MSPRLNPLNTDLGPKFVKHIVAANKAIADSTLPAATLELIRIRASQINGCAGCLDMHTKEAARAGKHR
jgi:AhpD family alkylhydroperoxidase